MNEKIRVSVDPDLEDLIPGFLENRKKDLQSLRLAMTAADLVTLQSIGHSLKGVGGGYGFNGMSEIGADIERNAKSGSIGEIGGQVEKLADYLERVEIVYE